MLSPKYSIGDKVTFLKTKWGIMNGRICLIGHQGNKVIYGIDKLANGGYTVCYEKNIINTIN